MAIELSGLGSGFDSSALVTALVDAARAPVNALQSKQQQIQSATTTVSSFSSKLSALRTAAAAISTPGGFSAATATSTDPAVVVSASGTAKPGNYSVQVMALAKEQRTRTEAQPSGTADLDMAGTLKLTVGAGSPVDVAIETTDSLADIANKISSSGARVSASVLFDGTSHRLIVRGLDSGESNTIAFDETGLSGPTTLGLSDPANTFQPAQDALIKLDGMPDPIKRPTNSIADVIPGVTLALVKQTTTDATVAVSADPKAITTKVQAFVKAYNDVISAGQTAAGYGASTASNAVLASDPAIRRSMDHLAREVTSLVPGSTGKYTTLGSVGVQISKDGKLELNASKFEAALAADPSSVERLFVKSTQTGATGVMASISEKVTDLTDSDSLVQAKIDSLGKQSGRVRKDIEAAERRITAYETQLKRQFTSLDSVMSRYNAVNSGLIASMNALKSST
jgi:flagellar hook-associated protein 2